MENLLTGKKIAIILSDGFEQIEMTSPKAALEKAGAIVKLISPEKKTVRGWNHDKPADEFPVDLTINEANSNDFTAILLPGGVINPDHLRLFPAVISFIRNVYEAGKPIAAICHGPWTLINAEVVKGRKMTSWPSLKADLTNAGANWVDQEVVIDGPLLTSRKPADLPAFNAAMTKLFGEYKK